MKRKEKWLFILIPIAIASLALTACGNSSSTTQTTAATTLTATTPVVSTQPPPTPPADRQAPTDRTPPTMDWVSAAQKLGITEEQLQQAFEGTEKKMPDMTTIASTLGVTEEALRGALGIPAGGPGMESGGQNPGIPPDSGSTPIPDANSSDSNSY